MVAGGLGIVDIKKSEEIEILSSDKDEHFTEAIALNAIEYEDIDGLIASKINIRGIYLQAKEPMLYTLWLWKDSGHANTDLNLDSNKDMINLDVGTSGKRIAVAGQYYLPLTGLTVSYEDTESPSAAGTYSLHCGLMVSSGAGKSAGVPGEVQIDISYSPRL